MLDTHALEAALEVLAIDAVTVSQQVSWPVIPRKCFDNLLGGPLIRVGFAVTLEMENPAALVGKDAFYVIHQEGPPRGGGRPPVANHVLGDSRLR